VAILWFYKSQRRSHRGEGTKEKHTERKTLTGKKKEKKTEKEQTESTETEVPRRTHGEKGTKSTTTKNC
jgi:hypothetical protein